jgi:heterodisulfide reductase subunit A-like polyferredoxin
LKFSRRTFIKVAGASAGAILVSLGLQNATVRNIKAEHIPGAGHPSEKGAGKSDEVYETRLKNIDTKAFLAGCSRCGVCLNKCPFGAIKSAGLAVPQLTEATARKCPGYEACGICAVVCPTDCLNDAFSEYREKYNKKPIAGDKPWWEGPYDASERDPSK